MYKGQFTYPKLEDEDLVNIPITETTHFIICNDNKDFSVMVSLWDQLARTNLSNLTRRDAKDQLKLKIIINKLLNVMM